MWRGRDALPRVRRSTSVEREYPNKHARTRDKGFRGRPNIHATPVARERKPYRATCAGMRSRTCNAGRAGAQPYRATCAGMRSRTCDAGRAERNPTTQCAGMRCRTCNAGRAGAQTLPRHMRRNAFQDVRRRSRGSAYPATYPRMFSRPATPVAAALADGGDRTHTLLPVLDFESSASANSATSAFYKEATTNPFAMKRKRQRRQPRLILNSATLAFCKEATTNPFAMKRKRHDASPVSF